MGHDRQELVRLFADLDFAPYGLSDWTGNVGVAAWASDRNGRIESITLAYGRGEGALVRVTTAVTKADLAGLLSMEDPRPFVLGLTVNGRISRFTAIGDGSSWAALRTSDGKGPNVIVAARDVKPTAVRLRRVAESQPYIDGHASF